MVSFAGRLAKDAESKNHTKINSETGKNEELLRSTFLLLELGKEKTYYHTVIVFQKERLIPYLKKGTVIALTGDLYYVLYKDKQTGKQHKYYEILARDITLLPMNQNNNQEEDKDKVS